MGATPDNRFLFAANGGSNDIRVFSIAANGALTAVGPLVPAGGTPDSIKVSPDGKFLSVALFDINQVAMFSIGSGGTLTPVPGSPFTAKGSGHEAGLDINCASNFLFGGEANPLNHCQCLQHCLQRGIDGDFRLALHWGNGPELQQRLAQPG